MDEELTAEEKQEVEQENRENELRRTDPAAYENLRYKRMINSVKPMGIPASQYTLSKPCDISSLDGAGIAPPSSTPTTGLQTKGFPEAFNNSTLVDRPALANTVTQKVAEDSAGASSPGLRPEFGSQLRMEARDHPKALQQQSISLVDDPRGFGVHSAQNKERSFTALDSAKIPGNAKPRTEPSTPIVPFKTQAHAFSPTKSETVNEELQGLTQEARQLTTQKLYKEIYDESLLMSQKQEISINHPSTAGWKVAKVLEGRVYRKADSIEDYEAMVQNMVGSMIHAQTLKPRLEQADRQVRRSQGEEIKSPVSPEPRTDNSRLSKETKKLGPILSETLTDNGFSLRKTRRSTPSSADHTPARPTSQTSNQSTPTANVRRSTRPESKTSHHLNMSAKEKDTERVGGRQSSTVHLPIRLGYESLDGLLKREANRS